MTTETERQSKLYMLFVAFVFMLPSVMAVEETINVSSNPFISNYTATIESEENTTIYFDYTNASFVSGLPSILAVGNITQTMLDIRMENVTDGTYVDRIEVNTTTALIDYTFIFMVSAGYTNGTRRLDFTISLGSLPFNRTENITLQVPADKQIIVTYDTWLSGQNVINSSSEGVTTFEVFIDIPREGVNVGSYVRTITTSVDSVLQSIPFNFFITQVLEPCIDKREEFNAAILGGDPNTIFAKYFAYKACIDENTPVQTINNTQVIPIPGDVYGWFQLANQLKDQEHQTALGSLNSQISSLQSTLQTITDDRTRLESEVSKWTTDFNALQQSKIDELKKIEEEQVNKWWKFFAICLIIVTVSGFFMYRKYEDMI